ncbi:MAG: hypothetical protein LQ345_005105 [Seirophora villosa]|nr:MAG: hypothetical protein LQ345_005105 [Seirophora villosa]
MSSPSLSPPNKVTFDKITTLVIVLYIAAPCLIFLFAVPITIFLVVRGVKVRRKEREMRASQEKRRRDFESVVGFREREGLPSPGMPAWR